MITNTLILIVYVIIEVILLPLALLPNVSVESGFGNAVEEVTHYLANFNQILPLTTLFQIIGLIFIIETGIIVYKIIMWLIRRFPTQS